MGKKSKAERRKADAIQKSAEFLGWKPSAQTNG